VPGPGRPGEFRWTRTRVLASTIGAFCSKLPSAGFAYTFNTYALGKDAGFLSGWLPAFT